VSALAENLRTLLIDSMSWVRAAHQVIVTRDSATMDTKLARAATISGADEVDQAIATLVLAFGTDPVARRMGRIAAGFLRLRFLSGRRGGDDSRRHFRRRFSRNRLFRRFLVFGRCGVDVCSFRSSLLAPWRQIPPISVPPSLSRTTRASLREVNSPCDAPGKLGLSRGYQASHHAIADVCQD
jgi:hypothetical protein